VDDQLRKLINCIYDAHLDAIIDCETCSTQWNCLAEMVAGGADPHELLPAVEEHLACCSDCREEYEALLAIIRAENQGLTAS
jgi:predicted anti-sigma-YlaC factor YlaD